MVIFAIALDVLQNKYIISETSSELTILKEGKSTPIFIGQGLTKVRKCIQRFSIVLMVLGTIIWGYGDLLFK